MKHTETVFNIKDFDWNNHEVLSKNRQPNRVHYYPYDNEATALIYDRDKSSRIELLNGTWDFKWLPSPMDVDIAGFKDTDGYESIKVPQNWQYSGYGKFVYTDMWYDFPVDAPFVSVNDNETGVYHREIHLESLKEQLSIRFEGVESAFHLYVNGEEIGYSQGSRYPSEFDITNAVVEGKNDLHVVVYQYCDGSYLEAQDMWWLGGIIRDVYLIERRCDHFNNLILDPDYDAATGMGIIKTNITITGSAQVTCKVYDGDVLIQEIEQVEMHGTVNIKDVSPWTAETPKLYTLVFALVDEAGQVIEAIPQRIGFRHLEIIQGQMLLNGKKILMKGVNRHEYSAKSGRAITYEETYNELRLIKQHHMNAVRTSHYPNNPFFYDICNVLGIYVIDEADLESHGLESVNTDTLLCDNPEYEAMYIDRVERLVERDRNHACVLIWSLGNESAYGVNFKAMYEWCKANEPTRPVHYESDALDESVDVSSTMYSTVGKLYEIDASGKKMPHILCEFGHAMGNGPGSFKEYFDVIEHSKRIQGMFVWEFKDQAVYQLGDDGKERYMFGGEFGEDFHNGNFCMDGMVMANDQPTPALKEYAKVIENIHVVDWSIHQRTLTVKNRYDFTPTTDIDVMYQVIVDNQVIKTVRIPLGDIEPQKTAVVSMPEDVFDFDTKEQVYLRMTFMLNESTFWCDAGFVIGEEQVLLNKPSIDIIPIEETIWVTEAFSCLVVQGKSFSVKISKRDGYLFDLSYRNQRILKEGPHINFYRAYTDNDLLNVEKWTEQHLHAMSMNVYELGYTLSESHVKVTVKGRVGARGLNWGCVTTLTYKISKDGYIELDWNGSFDGSAPKHLPKIGLQMKAEKSLGSVTYEGYGPEECYCDSKENVYEGIYQMPYEAMSFNYLFPQENGNRTGVKWATLTSEESGILFASETMDFSVRDVSDFDLNKYKHSVDLPQQEHLILNCDMMNSGLGSQACGPDRMDQYKAFTKPFEFSLVMKPMNDVKDILNEARNLTAYKINE